MKPLLLSIGCAVATATRPNFVVLFVDDYGWGDMGANGYQNPSETPNLDALASQGMRFTDFHAMPLCTPSRAQLLTGRLAPRTDVFQNWGTDALYGLNNTEITLGEFMKRNGYATAIRGKWHLGHNPPHHPSYRGFDDVVSVPYSIDMGCVFNSSFYVPPTGARIPVIPACDSPGGTSTPALPLYKCTTNCTNANVTSTGDCNAAIASQPLDLSALSDTYNDENERFIKASAAAGTPFFLYVPFSHTHVPLMTASRWVNASAGKTAFLDVVREVDNSVGAVLAALEAAGVVETTPTCLQPRTTAPGRASAPLRAALAPSRGCTSRCCTPTPAAASSPPGRCVYV